MIRPVTPSDASWVHRSIGEHQPFARWCVPGFLVSPDTLQRLMWLDVVGQAVFEDLDGRPLSMLQIHDPSPRTRRAWFSVLLHEPPGTATGAASLGPHIEAIRSMASDLRLERMFAHARAQVCDELAKADLRAVDRPAIAVAGRLPGFLRIEGQSIDAALLDLPI